MRHHILDIKTYGWGGVRGKGGDATNVGGIDKKDVELRQSCSLRTLGINR